MFLYIGAHSDSAQGFPAFIVDSALCEVWLCADSGFNSWKKSVKSNIFSENNCPHMPHFNQGKFDVNRLSRIYFTRYMRCLVPYIRLLNARYYSAFMIEAEICELYMQKCFALIYAQSINFFIHATSSMCTASPWDCWSFFYLFSLKISLVHC